MDTKNKPYTKGTRALFKSRFLDKLTRTHIAVPLVVFTIISTILVIYGIQKTYTTVLSASLLFFTGFLAFTLVEYIMHRFLFHLPPTSERTRRFTYTVHGVHHDFPKDKDRLAMPIPVSLTLTTIFYLLYRLLMGNLVYGFLPGFLMGYAFYLWVHYMVHAYRPPKNFWKILWVHHGIHHYKEPERAFGVSSPLWDMVFGTMPKK